MVSLVLPPVVVGVDGLASQRCTANRVLACPSADEIDELFARCGGAQGALSWRVTFLSLSRRSSSAWSDWTLFMLSSRCWRPYGHLQLQLAQLGTAVL